MDPKPGIPVYAHWERRADCGTTVEFEHEKRRGAPPAHSTINMFPDLYLSWFRRLLRLAWWKRSETMALNAGILIIGSLLWDEKRQEWRNARLDRRSQKTVAAPIRYGRLSGKRRGLPR